MWEQAEQRARGIKPQSDKLIDRLPDVFDKEDVENAQKDLGLVCEVKKSISKLKERGLIKLVRGCKNLYSKT